MSKSSESHRIIKTAIIVDFVGGGGQTPEQEIAGHKKRFSRLLKPAKLSIHTPHHAGPGDHGIQPGTELVIYDFGGLMPGSSLMEDNSRDVIQWAQDNPNGLVIVVSSFTYRNFIQIELQQLGLDSLFNIISDDSWAEDAEEKLIPDWFKTK